MRPFLLLFLLFPVLELFVFVKVAGAIGFFPALLLIILGSMFGVFVLRIAGLATAQAAHHRRHHPAHRPTCTGPARSRCACRRGWRRRHRPYAGGRRGGRRH